MWLDLGCHLFLSSCQPRLLRSATIEDAANASPVTKSQQPYHYRATFDRFNCYNNIEYSLNRLYVHVQMDSK